MEDAPIEVTVSNNRIAIKLDSQLGKSASGKSALKGTIEGEISDSGKFVIWGYNEYPMSYWKTITIEGTISGDIAEGSVKWWGKFRLQRVSTP